MKCREIKIYVLLSNLSHFNCGINGETSIIKLIYNSGVCSRGAAQRMADLVRARPTSALLSSSIPWPPFSVAPKTGGFVYYGHVACVCVNTREIIRVCKMLFVSSCIIALRWWWWRQQHTESYLFARFVRDFGSYGPPRAQKRLSLLDPGNALQFCKSPSRWRKFIIVHLSINSQACMY